MRSLLVCVMWCGVACVWERPAEATVAYCTDSWEVTPPEYSLHTFQTSTGGVSGIGMLGVPDQMTGLAWDRGRGVMYGIVFGGSFWQVNLTTGHSTLVGQTGIARPGGLAVNPANGNVYGVSYDGQVFRVNPMTGAASIIGTPANQNLAGLSFAPDGRAIAGRVSLGGLFEIDLNSGVQTQLFSGPSLSGLGFDPADGQLYGIDNYYGRSYRISLETGAYTNIGPFFSLHNPKALAFVPGPTVVTAWCAAGGIAIARRRRAKDTRPGSCHRSWQSDRCV